MYFQKEEKDPQLQVRGIYGTVTLLEQGVALNAIW
jgi:hypothetical protein